MKSFFKKPKMFGIIFGLVLTLAGSFVLLDTFVIPKAMATVTTSTVTTTTTDSTVATGDEPTINITTVRENDTTVYIADIVLSDISQLKTAFAEDTYGLNIKETTSEMAENNDAVLAINGDYYGFRNSGYVIRNGVLYRETSAGNDTLAIMDDGSFKIYTEGETSAASILNQGALQTFSFGPVLVNNGEVAVTESEEVSQSMTSNPRTAIGIVSPLHYIVVVSDGRTDESEGLTLYQLANVMADEGCTIAYNLDGGGSTTMWYKGEIVNNPTSGHGISEREVSDIVYFTN